MECFHYSVIHQANDIYHWLDFDARRSRRVGAKIFFFSSGTVLVARCFSFSFFLPGGSSKGQMLSAILLKGENLDSVGG